MGIFSKISQKFSDVKKPPSLKKGTEVFWNGDFYYVESKLDQGALRDPDGIHFYYGNDVDPATLGSGIIACLNKCRDLGDGDEASLMHAELARKNASTYPTRLADEMKRFGYKHKKARNHNMLKVVVTLNGKTITLEPTNHIALENWTEEKIDPIDHISVDSNVDDAEIGRLVKLAFERCKNDFNASIPKKKPSSSPAPADVPKHMEKDVYDMSLLCNGDLSAAEDIWREVQKSTDSHAVFLGSELSKKGYCFSSNWKGALLNFQDAFKKFIAHYAIKDIAFNEIEDSIYASTDIVDCILVANAWLLKYGYTIMYLNELPDMCELVLVKNSDLERVSSYLKRLRGIDMQSPSASW